MSRSPPELNGAHARHAASPDLDLIGRDVVHYREVNAGCDSKIKETRSVGVKLVPSDGRLIVAIRWLSILSVTTTATAKPATPTHQNDPTPLSAQSLRASIGRTIGQPGFDPAADLNLDGVVNALDVALFKLAQREGCSPSRSAGTAPVAAGTERIVVETPITAALPGQTVSVLFVIRDNAVPLTSYTVEVGALADPGAVGSVTAIVGLTNFFDQRNIITACPPAICPTGAMRDPLFSVITGNGAGGVSVTTITDDFSTVLAVDDVNDVLAQVFFDIAPDALGDFAIQLDSGSILVDGDAVPVSFAFTPGTIRVLDPADVPTVSEWGMIVLSVLLVAAGCVVFAKRRGATR